MEFGTYHHYSRQPNYTYPTCYSPGRNPHHGGGMLRQDARSYPFGAPNSGLRGRGSGVQEEDSSGTPRRRIAVACARCRKRKIRCSGDPGNGSGCHSCKQAGADINQCQFHRVGSTEAIIAYEQHVSGFPIFSSGPLSPNAMIPAFSQVNNYHSRSTPLTLYPQLDTKPAFPHPWTIPFSEETSPVETYGLDQPAAYMTSSNTITPGYGQGYRWHQANQRALHNRQYFGQDSSSSQNLNGLPYIQTSNASASSSTEALSSLNMTSIQSALPVSLPERPRLRQSHGYETTIPQRQLPVPQPSPAQTTRNVVDQLQDQRLRSGTVVGAPSVNITGSYRPLTWPMAESIGGLGNLDLPTAESSSIEPSPQTTTAAESNTAVNDATTGISPGLSPGAESTSTASTQPLFSFSTAPLLEPSSMATPAATYSNFRDCPNMNSSSNSTSSFLRRYSQTNAYGFHTSSKMSTANGSDNAGTLVSGQRYTPLRQSQSQQHTDFRMANKPIKSVTEISRNLE